MKRIFSFPVIILLVLCLGTLAVAGKKDSPKKGVYEYVVQKATVSFDEAVSALQTHIQSSPFELVKMPDSAAPEGCDFRTKIFVLYDSAYAAQLLPLNRLTAPFAVLNRINVFEDENGVQVSIVNPVNINRTILMEDEKYNGLSESQRQKLRALVTEAVPGEVTEKQYGPIRKKGYIGRTMGVMAGGAFDGKIKVVAEVSGGDFGKVVQKLQNSLSQGEGKWDMKLAFAKVLEAQGVAVLGTSSPAIEAKSFDIVKAGGDKSRKKFKCPGIAHAAAYPIEVVVLRDGETVKVLLVNIMYRMKMFFEDAGKWAFMKNMGMPGSIQDEIEGQITAAFPAK